MREQQAKPARARHDFIPAGDMLDLTIAEAATWLISRQGEDGHWVFELEADATISSEYILLNHYLGDIDDTIERQIANYLRRTQGKHGGWPLFYDGDFDLSASVKAYYALKLVGDDPQAEHMRRAREVILAHGGAARASVFARIGLALFEQVPWRAAPWIRPEAMLMPKWALFHIEKVSYWSRTVMVPLFVLARAQAEGTQSARYRHTRAVHDAARGGDPLPEEPDRAAARRPLSRARSGRPSCRPSVPARDRALRHRQGDGFRQGTVEWGGRLGRDLPRHGVCPDVFRRARLSAR